MLAAWGATTSNIDSSLLAQAFTTVVILGVVGGLYPAWRASRLEPVEALRYEGGAGGKAQRLPVGGMAAQGLWQRKARTFLTLGVIGITIGRDHVPGRDDTRNGQHDGDDAWRKLRRDGLASWGIGYRLQSA